MNSAERPASTSIPTISTRDNCGADDTEKEGSVTSGSRSISIKNIPKPLVLKALYDAPSNGQGYAHTPSLAKDLAIISRTVTISYQLAEQHVEDANTFVSFDRRPVKGNYDDLYFDYVYNENGFPKAIKAQIGGDEMDPGTYDEYHGSGAAEKAILQLNNLAKSSGGMEQLANFFTVG